jgi:putative sporulation protein YyaC
MDLIDIIDKTKEPYFICVGSAKSCLDSVAPKVGSKLKKLGYNVIGIMEEPLHALNIHKKIEDINTIDLSKYELIPIDAMYCEKEERNIITEHRPLKPGGSYGKNLPKVGTLVVGINISKEFSEWLHFHIALGKEEGYEHIVDPLVEECVEYIQNTYRKVDSVEAV